MPKLGDFRTTKEVELSQYPESKIVIYDSVLMRDAVASSLDFNNLSNQDQSKMLHLFIKEWNFTDENDQLLPITPENIELLRMDAVTKLSEVIKEFAEEQKKN